MPSERLPAPASPHDTASFISALHERKGDGPPLFSSLSANPDSGHISGGLDLRLPSEGSTVPALPQVAALGLQNSSLLGVASDPLGPPATISLHLPWTEFHALTLSDDTALGHSFSSISPSFMGNATHHTALPSQQGKFALSSLVSLAPQFSAHSMPEGIPAPTSSLMASPHFSAPSFSSVPLVYGPSAPLSAGHDAQVDRDALHRLIQSWPQLDELRLAARGSFNRVRPRWRHARSSLAASIRMEFVAALQASRCRGPHASPRDDVGWAVLLMHGSARFEDVCFLLRAGIALLAQDFHWSDRCLAEAVFTLNSVVGPPAVFSNAVPPAAPPLDGGSGVEDFPHVLTVFAGALSSGWPWALCIRLFTTLRAGRFSSDGRYFWTAEADRLGFWSRGRSMEDWSYGSIISVAYDHTVGVFFRDGVVGVLVSNKSMTCRK